MKYFEQFAFLFFVVAVSRGAVAHELRGAQEPRGKLGMIPLETEIEVLLVSGETIRGKLTHLEAQSFAVRAPIDPDVQGRMKGRDATTNYTIRYEDVERVEPTGDSLEAFQRETRVGSDARVELVSGNTVKGKIEAFDGDSLQVDGRTWRLSEGEVSALTVSRSDSLRNGALIGAGVGVGLAGWTYAACGTNCPDNGAAAAMILGMGVGLGVLFDALTGESHEYRFGADRSGKQLTLAPIVENDAKGLALSVRW